MKQQRWNQDVNPVARRSPIFSAQRRQAMWLALGLLTVAGAALGLCGWLHVPPHPYVVPVWVAEYRASALPMNVTAWRDRKAMLQARGLPSLGTQMISGQQRHLLVEQLAALAQRPATEDVVVFVCAYAAFGPEGVSVLPADADLDDPQTWLPLRRILNYLAACPAERKLLILDMMWPITDAGDGLLSTNVAAAIPGELEAVPDPHRLVLCPCSPGQVSLSSLALKRSVFGHYFERGLGGEADGYNPEGLRDGQIGVRELSNYLTARVDRFAWQNLGTRQTPQLLGDGPDFAVSAAPEPGWKSELIPTPFVRYPQWLTSAWNLRDRWAAADGWRAMPHVMRQLETALLRAESAWSQGGETATVQASLQSRVSALTQQQAAVQAFLPSAEPRSLALAVARGASIDPTLGPRLESLVTHARIQTTGLPEPQAQAIRAKLIQDFQKQVASLPHVTVAYAVFQFAVDSPAPDAMLLMLLDAVLRENRAGAPQFVETEFLRNLSHAAHNAQFDPWPTAVIQSALRAFQLNEELGTRAWPLPWLNAQSRPVHSLVHDGLTYLWSVGYASIDQAEEKFRAAIDQAQRLMAYQAMLVDAYAQYDRSFAQLPVCLPLLEQDPSLAPSWQQLVALASRLAGLLDAGLSDSSDPLSQLSQIRQVSEELRQQHDRWELAWNAATIDALVAACHQDNAGPAEANSVRTLLSTPLPSAVQRGRLWEAGYRLAIRLAGATRLEDQADNEARRPTMPLAPYDQPQFLLRQQALTWLRARNAVETLILGGLSGSTMSRLQELAQAGNPLQLNAISTLLRQANQEDLPEQLEHAPSLASRARLCRICPAWDMPTNLEYPSQNPAVCLAAETQRLLWLSLGDRYRFASRDLNGLPFYADVASQYLALAGSPPESYLQLSVEVAQADLTSENSGQARIEWQVVGSNASAIAARTHASAKSAAAHPHPSAIGAENPVAPSKVSFSQPSGQPLVLSLLSGGKIAASGGATINSVVGTAWESAPLSRLPTTLVVDVALSRDASPDTVAAVKGFLVEVEFDGRTYHQQVPLPKTILAPVEILLSSNPTAPTPALDMLQLRPLATPQPYYLFVRSLESKPRQVLVSVGTASTKLALLPGKTSAVSFVGEPPKAGQELPPLTGPLVITTTDAETGELLATKTIGVAIAQPREYVEVSQISFEGWGPERNRLQVSLAGVQAGPIPPVTAELVLPPDAIPGFLGSQGGVFRGALLPGNRRLNLSAENIRQLEGASEQGQVYVNVDGVPRVFIFDVTFASDGQQVVPTEHQRPGLRLVADPAYLPGPSTAIGIQVDSPPSGSTLSFAIGRQEGPRFVPEMEQMLGQPREQRLGCSPYGPGGAILLSARLGDWDLSLDTSGIVGERTLLAKLFSYDGNVLETAETAVVFDDVPPAHLQVIPPIDSATAGQPYLVKALCTRSLSGVASAQFFVGRPVDGKLPEKTPTVSGVPIDDQKLEWFAELPIPADAIGTIPISVQFTNRVGLSDVATTVVAVQSAEQAGLGTLAGQVLEGPRPQAGLTVTLSTAGGTALFQATSGPDGSFRFPNLKPGSYKVSAAKTSSSRQGEAAATVEAGKTANANVSLQL